VTFNAPHLRRAPRPAVIIPIVVLVILIILVLTVGQNLYIDLLFFRSVHYSNVFSTVLWTRLLLFVIVGLLGAVAVGANVVLAYVLRPTYVPMSPEQQQLEGYRVNLQPYRKALLILLAGVFGIFFGAAAQHRWSTVQLFLHGQSFHQKDPQFHRDVSYYMFTLPFERMILTYLFAAVFVSFVIAAILHYLYGGIRIQTRGEKVSAAAKAHLSVLLGLFVLLKAFAYYLDRYGLMFSGRGKVTGAGYADVHATLPAKNILLVIAILCAILFFANAFRRGFALPAIAFGLLVLSSIVIGGLYPFLVQQFQVGPNAINKEAKYIGRNIAATRTAYGIEPKDPKTGQGTVVTTSYPASTPSATAVSTDKANVPNTRLLDPAKLQATYEQLQQLRSYYGFGPSLDVDRYTIDGKEQTYLVAAREVDLTGLAASQKNWPNEHLVYTHGQGFVAAPVNTVDPNSGQPQFAVQDIPPTGPTKASAPSITIDQARVYYGELSPNYSIVDTKQKEVDGLQAANYTYDGTGGVDVGSKLFRRLALAVHFKDYNLFFSSAVNKSSQILFNRDPRERVGKVAPWLRLDGDPYPAMIGGRLTWIVDGYTTSDNYPYSERVSLGSATTTTTTQTASNVSSQNGQVNYIRNSVKATVDAFTGKVTLYAFEQGKPDPVLDTWEKVFPGSVQPESKISPELLAHIRYPEDLFNVQRELLTRYHVSDPKAFFQQGDFWEVPEDPTVDNGGTAQPPYYSTSQFPGQTQPTFNLETSLNFKGRPNLAAVAAVSSDPADYGTIRILDLPNTTNINGPRNVENQIQSDTSFKPTLTLLNQNGSSVVRGNLQALPVGGGFLFVQPFYAQGEGNQKYPTLKYVVVVYGDRVGFAANLQDAVSQALAGGGQATTAPSTTPSTTPSTSPSTSPTATPSSNAPSTTPSATPTTGPSGGSSLGALAQQVSTDANAVRAAQASGDLAKISAAQAKYSADLAKLVAALNLPG
jgi:uncharacterized membrane protein (UPF0182 family)